MNKFATALLLSSASAHLADKLVRENDKVHLDESEMIHISKFFAGYLDSFGVHVDVLDLLMCIRDEDNAAIAAYMSVTELEKAYKEKNPQDAVVGAIAAVAAFKQFEQGLPVCEKVVGQDFSKVEAATTNAMDHPIETFKEFDLKKERLMAAVKAGDYTKMGKAIAEIVKPKETEMETVDDRTLVADFMKGFLEATNVGTFNFTALLICIYEADQTALIIYTVIHMLQDAIKNKDYQELIGVAIGTIAAVQQFKQTVPVCMSVDSKSLDWTTFDEITAVAEDPEHHMELVGKNIVFNGITITHDLHKALESYRAGDIEKFGFELGKALSLVVEPRDDLFLF
jgi:thermostable 8-oxoguanine DNA glycosylase